MNVNFGRSTRLAHCPTCNASTEQVRDCSNAITIAAAASVLSCFTLAPFALVGLVVVMSRAPWLCQRCHRAA